MMRKITLMCAFALGGLTSMAQTLTEGWYRFMAVSGNNLSGLVTSGTATVLNCEDEYRQSASNYYALKYAAYSADKAPTSWVYVTPVSGISYAVQALNGHYVGSMGLSYRTGRNLNIEPDGDNVKIGGYWEYFSNNGSESPYVGGSSGDNGKSNRYSYVQITETDLAGYDKYTVSITGAPDQSEIGNDMRVTCSHAENKGIAAVYNNGCFFITAGAEVSADDFTATPLENYEVTLSITDKVVNVEYILQAKKLLSEAIPVAETLLAKTGVGYPADGAAERTTLQAAIDAAKSALENNNPTAADVEDLNEALSTYNATTNVVMPEDGKAYRFINIGFDSGEPDGNEYLLYDGANTMMSFTADVNSITDLSDLFVCRKIGDKFLFVNAKTGKYMFWRNLVENYSENAPFTVGYGTYQNNANGSSLFMPHAFTFYLAHRADSGSDTRESYLVFSRTGWGADSRPWCGDYHSALYRLEEVEYPNRVTLAEATGLEDYIATIGTFSAPYAALVPEGVHAYYVKTLAGDNSVAYTMPVEAGKAIPANTGVLLAATEATVTSALMIPAAGEERAELSGNLLGNSAGADKAIPAEENAYVLSKTSGSVAFRQLSSEASKRNLKMNKAYLVAPASVSGETSSFSIGFDFSDVTSVGRIEANPVDTADAPVYDLFGRRVPQVLKGGIYIRCGKKFIVK